MTQNEWKRDDAPNIVFELQIYGDWYSVIRAVEPDGELWNRLLRQKPLDEEDADYFVYRLRFHTSEALLEAAEAFRKQKLQVAVAVNVKSEELGVEVFAATGDGFSRRDVFGWVKRAPSEAEQLLQVDEKLRELLALRKRLSEELSGGERTEKG